MPWTNPFTAIPGQLMTAALWNQMVRDNQNLLKTSINDNGTLKTLLDKNTTEQFAENTTAEISVYGFIVPGGTLGIGNVLRLTVDGFVSSAVLSVDLTVRVVWGGVVVFANTQSMTASTIGPLKIVTDIIADGWAGAQNIVATYVLPAVGSSIPPGGGAFSSGTIIGGYRGLLVDSSVNQGLSVTYQWSVADPNHSAMRAAATLECLRTT
jgi:hypothetical protein